MRLIFLIVTFAAFLVTDVLSQSSLEKHADRKDVDGVDGGDAEMLAAQEKARESLGDFVEALKNRKDDQRYLVKVRLEEGDEVEHVWLEPVKWVEPGLKGILAVDPVAIKKYSKGDVIAPRPKEISDWLILLPDGGKKGGYTVDVIAKRKKG